VEGVPLPAARWFKLLNQDLINLAADEFLRWNKIGRAESRGLTRRRIAERNLFLTGEYSA
jgi:lysozyme